MRIGLIIVVAILLCSCGNKSQRGNKQIILPEEKTSIEFKEKAHNFGQLIAGEIVIHSFEFTNTGEYDYWIENVVADCACIHTRFKKELVKPGEKGRIEVEFNSAGTAGKEYKTIEIYGNSKELKHIAIFAEVKNEIIDIKY